MKGEWQFAGPLARTFVEFHRYTAISYKMPLVDLLVGAAHLVAEYNGIERASLLGQADAALYRGKQASRNAVHLAEPAALGAAG